VACNETNEGTGMKQFIKKFSDTQILPLSIKEFNHIRHNRRLIVSLIIQPIFQILLFGLAINPEVVDLRLGIVDESRTKESRDLISAFVESGSFKIVDHYSSHKNLEFAIRKGELDAGIIVPVNFNENLSPGQTGEAQLIIDAVDSNTATVASSYASLIVDSLNRPQTENSEGRMRITLLYNAGLRYSWFILSAITGVLIILNGSIVAAAAMVNEKESGTIELLLLLPVQTYKIIIAKVVPLFVLLFLQCCLALTVGRLVFGTPLRGSLVILLIAFALCVLISIGIGIAIATFSRSQLQTQLMSIFVIPPIAMLSGAMTPLEAMPQWLQLLTYANPARHFSEISRGVMLKGSGLDVIYPNLIALMLCAIILLYISIRCFRRQLD
jgi:ABC-2 type transport system permease protein